MKKILLILIILILTINNTYAAGSCLIKNETAPFLTDFIKENRTIIKNITKKIQEESLNTKTQNKKIGNILKETTKFYNTIINWTGYYSYFKYYVTFPIKNEIPFPINRDYRLIDNELKGLNKYYLKIVQKGYGDIKFGTGTINSNLKKELIKYDNLINNYRLAVMGDELNGSDETLKNNLIQYYGNNAAENCSLEDGFAKQILDKISEIKDINKNSDKAIQKWKDAWDLLVGNSKDTEGYAELEKKLLAQELSRQGVPMEQQTRMLKQLKDFNREGFNLKNNFISNTFDTTIKSITDQLKQFKKDVFDDFKVKYEKNPNEKDVDINSLLKNKDKNDITSNIASKITTLYENEVNLASQADVNVDKLTARIIKMHGNLKESIKILQNTIKISQKVCNSQDSGEGNCK